MDDKDDKPVHSKWELSEVLLVTTGAVCQQGTCQLPKLMGLNFFFCYVKIQIIILKSESGKRGTKRFWCLQGWISLKVLRIWGDEDS